ncbi:MAG: tetratricopeptide repeat protein [Chitinophagales bacterium]|nr:tetratricopeptide repeat protein [Chitinophagales bacterium]
MIKNIYYIVLLIFCQVGMAQQKHQLLEMGDIYLKHNNYAMATNMYQQYIKLFPNDTGYYHLGNVLRLQKQYEEAIINLEKSIHYNKNFQPAYSILGKLYNEQFDYNTAIMYLDAALKINPNADDYNERGMSYYKLNNFEQAIDNFDMALGIDSTLAICYNNRASAKYNNQNIAKASKADLLNALEDYNKAIAINNKLALSYRNRAFVYYYLDSLELALNNIEQSIYLYNKDDIAFFCLGLILYKEKKYSNALEAYNQSIFLANYIADSYLERAKTYLALKDFAHATTDLNQVILFSNELKGESYLYLAAVAAWQKDKNTMLYNIKKANNQSLFDDSKYIKYLQEYEAFDTFKNDADFKKLLNKIKFGKK